MQNKEIYKLYNIQENRNYKGTNNKFICTMKGEQGIFKLPLNSGSKDHIVEEICYRLANLLQIPCVYARVRKTEYGIGVFSRFEIKSEKILIHANEIYNSIELSAEEYIKLTLLLFGEKSKILYKSIQLLAFDFLTGQIDRHLLNIAFTQTKKGTLNLYELYDNGLALYSMRDDDTAINWLNKGNYSGRMGNGEHVYEALRYALCLCNSKITNFIQLDKINYNVVLDIIQNSDRYEQIIPERAEAMAKFICRQSDKLKELV